MFNKQLIYKKNRCVNFTLCPTSWVNFACLSSNSANLLSLHLHHPPDTPPLARVPAWSAGLITQVRTLPASLGPERV